MKTHRISYFSRPLHTMAEDGSCNGCGYEGSLCECYDPPEGQPQTIVVTRHKGLVEYILETHPELVPDEGLVLLEHVTLEDVQGHHVIGVLPMHLALVCESYMEIPLNLPKELRGVELTKSQVAQYASPPVKYKVLKWTDYVWLNRAYTGDF